MAAMDLGLYHSNNGKNMFQKFVFAIEFNVSCLHFDS